MTAEFTAGDSLATLLTTESLLLAALGITVARAGNVPRGQRRIPTFPVAVGIAALLSIVAFAAAVSWFDIFGGGAVQGFWDWVPAGGIAAGIVGEVLVAWVLACAFRP